MLINIEYINTIFISLNYNIIQYHLYIINLIYIYMHIAYMIYNNKTIFYI